MTGWVHLPHFLRQSLIPNPIPKYSIEKPAPTDVLLVHPQRQDGNSVGLEVLHRLREINGLVPGCCRAQASCSKSTPCLCSSPPYHHHTGALYKIQPNVEYPVQKLSKVQTQGQVDRRKGQSNWLTRRTSELGWGGTQVI